MSQSNIHNQSYSSSQADEIDLAELWKAIWAGKFIIIIISTVFTVASIFYALSQPNVYKASVLLSPVEAKTSGNLGALSGSLGGFASMAGINLGSGSSDKTGVALEILQSRHFIVRFIKEHQLTVPLIAVNDYDIINDKLIIDTSVYNLELKTWAREYKAPKTSEPTSWELYDKFSKLLTVNKDKTSSMITLELSYYSPILAKQWLIWLVEDLNSFMRKQDEQEAQSAIDYLNKQLDKTNVASMEDVFYQLIEEQSKSMMLTQIKPEYVLKTIDPAQVPDTKDKPSRALIVLLGMIIGGMLSVLIVLVRYFTNKPLSSIPNDKIDLAELGDRPIASSAKGVHK